MHVHVLLQFRATFKPSRQLTIYSTPRLVASILIGRRNTIAKPRSQATDNNKTVTSVQCNKINRRFSLILTFL